MKERLTIKACLPGDRARATLIGRLWAPDKGGPVPILVRDDAVYDLSRLAPTVHGLCELADPAGAIRGAGTLPHLGDVRDALANSSEHDRDAERSWLLAPCDLQAIKASGVTFVSSMLERVIEEQARGDPAKAEAVRKSIVSVIGDNLSSVRPGSPEAARLKDVLIKERVWSQYLEVGIGPDAEIFTKSQPMSAIGLGGDIGLHPKSEWNNPEPEIVLVVNSRGRTVGATLGNDVNLRDFEGRSALLLGKAKDNNASCAIGPFIRLFDDAFGIDDVRRCELAMRVDGPEGFVLDGASSMAQDQPRSARSRHARDRAEPPVSGRPGALSWYHVRADQGSACAGRGFHARGRRYRHGDHTAAGRARQSRRSLRSHRAVDLRRRRRSCTTWLRGD